MCVVSRERRALGRGGIWINPTVSLQKFAIHGLFAGARISCWSSLYSCRVGYWFRSPWHSWIWVIASFFRCGLPLPSLHWRLFTGVGAGRGSNPRWPGYTHASVTNGPSFPPPSDSLFTAPTHRNACLLLWWWIKMDNDDYYVMMMYLLYNYDCYLECSSFKLHLYSCIIYMTKIFKVKYWK
jgi:hypothetical protein